MAKTLLCIGYGYSARAVAARLIPEGWCVIGTTRRAENAEAIAQTGAEALIWPSADLSDALAQADYLLISAGPALDGDPVLEALADVLAKATFKWVGYLSTTSVYGDHQGAWVDETTPLNPSTARGQSRAEAEGAWQATGLPLHIFRLAGIYGPGRGPFSKVRKGTARRILKEGQVFSRIHVDDIASALVASISQPNPGGIYNLCDDDPAPPQDVIAYAAELLGLPPPPEVHFEEAELSAMARSFYAENKRVRNARLKAELGVQLRYPSYRDGLPALLAHEQNGTAQTG